MAVAAAFPFVVCDSLADSGSDTVKTVAEALSLTAETCSKPRPFEFTGTVISRGNHVWAFSDQSAACPITNRRKDDYGQKIGDTVRIRGEMTVAPDEVPAFIADPPEVLRRGSPPEPVKASVADIIAGRFNYRLVTVRGVLVSVMKDEVDTRFCWATLRAKDDELFMPMSDEWNDIRRLQALIDAEVEVVGFAMPSLGWRHNLPPNLNVGDDSWIRVLRPPPEDPFSAPVFDNTIAIHRRCVEGEVVAVGKDRFFLRTKTSRIMPVRTSANASMPDTGDLVTVAAFAANDPYRLKMFEALVRVDGKSGAEPEETCPISIEDLYLDKGGHERINIHYDCKPIKVKGKVIGHGNSGNATTDELQLVNGERSVIVEIAAIRDKLAALPDNGSVVEVVGLCIVEFEQQAVSTILPRFRQFTVIPFTAADVRVLSRPPWWTPGRLLAIIGALFVVIVCIVFWNRSLQKAVERRGRELHNAETSKADAELRTDERTRLAVELHDSLSQTLTGAFFQVEAAVCAQREDPASVGRCLSAAMSTIQSCREELKNCLWDLRNNALDETDAESAIRRVICPHIGKAALSLKVDMPRTEISDNTFHALLRMLRELVSNAVRHGQARNIEVSATLDSGVIRLAVSDDGVGFDPERRPGADEGHFGLQGINDRLKRMSGSMSITSAPGAGTNIEISAEL